MLRGPFLYGTGEIVYVLIRDGEVNKVHVYNNLTPDAADILTHLLSHVDIFSVYKSNKLYDPAIAHEFLETGEVSDNKEVDIGGK